MGVEVLQSASEIDHARTELNRRGLFSLTSPSRGQRILQKVGLVKGIAVGDYRKSWDVLRTATFITARVQRNAPILDVGAYASELLCVLHRLGYTNLTGIDVNPHVRRMPYAGAIRYEVSDIMHTSFQKESFEIITAISVIEHGFNTQALLAEISRFLRPGGYFIASFDYWPVKVETTGIRLFGTTWTVFSQQEVLALLDQAREYHLTPNGEITLTAREQTIHYADRNYTFAWMALRKDRAQSSD